MLYLGQLWLKRPRQTDDPLLRAYTDICLVFARKGLARKPSEGPLDFSKRIATHWPRAQARTDALMREFIALRYQANQSPDFAKRTKQWKKEALQLLRTSQLFEQ